MPIKDLTKKLTQGDNSAYAYLFSEYYTWLCNYVFKLTNDKIVAEDLVQEVFINLWKKREKIEIKSSIKSYLFKSCHNQFLQYVRKEKIRTDFLNSIRQDVLFTSYEKESQEIYENKIEKLNSLIGELPPRCKQVFVLSKIHNKKYKEIAKELNISIKTVENHISKAYNFLRKNAVSALVLGISNLFFKFS